MCVYDTYRYMYTIVLSCAASVSLHSVQLSGWHSERLCAQCSHCHQLHDASTGLLDSLCSDGGHRGECSSPGLMMQVIRSPCPLQRNCDPRFFTTVVFYAGSVSMATRLKFEVFDVYDRRESRVSGYQCFANYCSCIRCWGHWYILDFPDTHLSLYKGGAYHTPSASPSIHSPAVPLCFCRCAPLVKHSARSWTSFVPLSAA